MKVLLVHANFNVIGGAEKVALYILESLIEEGAEKVDILTFTPFDVSYINNEYNFCFDAKKIDFIQLSQKYRSYTLNLNYLAEITDQCAGKYDVVIGSYNELPTSAYAMQYIHHPVFANSSILKKYHINIL